MRTYLSIGFVCLVATPSVQAQNTVCPDILIGYARPASLEWTYWLGVGGGWHALGRTSEHAVVDLRIGGGFDASVARLGAERQYGGPVELRLGPWIQGSTDIDNTIAEGGFMFDVGQTSHARWGTFGVRIGAGATFDSHGARQVRSAGSATLTWGIRYAPGRYSDGGACADEQGLNAGTPTADHGFVTGIRLFGTLRVDETSTYSLVFGVEFEPWFFFPPYRSMARWIGAP